MKFLIYSPIENISARHQELAAWVTRHETRLAALIADLRAQENMRRMGAYSAQYVVELLEAKYGTENLGFMIGEVELNGRDSLVYRDSKMTGLPTNSQFGYGE